MSRSLIINFDGGNEKDDAVWAVIAKTDKNVICTLSGRSPQELPQTNNTAESLAAYQALLFAYSLRNYYDFIQIMGDSLLVVNQIKGVYACKAEHLKDTINNARKIHDLLLNRFNTNFNFGWVSREINKEPDEIGRVFRKQNPLTNS